MARAIASAVFGLLLLAALPASAAPLIRVGNGTAASCTEAAFRNAVAVADAQGGGTIYFRCGSRPVTIILFEPLTLPDNTTVTGGDRITLEAGLINDAWLNITMTIDAGSSVILSDLTIRLGYHVIDNHGSLTIQSSTISGAVNHNLVNTGTLTILNSTICCEMSDVMGGGVLNGGTLIVSNTTFADSFGGGIANGGTATVINSRFTNNQWQHGFGGAIWNTGTMSIYTSTFTNNLAAPRGGAIENSGTLTVYGSTFSGNIASRGGAISNSGMLRVVGSSITGNTARLFGGGIHTYCGGRTTLLLTTVAGNSPDNVVTVPPDQSCPVL
jgi:hypothetical protein